MEESTMVTIILSVVFVSVLLSFLIVWNGCRKYEKAATDSMSTRKLRLFRIGSAAVPVALLLVCSEMTNGYRDGGILTATNALLLAFCVGLAIVIVFMRLAIVPYANDRRREQAA